MTDIDSSVGDIILDNEPPPDCDSVGDASSFFPLKFHQSTSACVGLDTCSIAQLCHVSKSHVCSLSNTGQVNLFDVGETSLGQVWKLSANNEFRITNIAASKGDENNIYTCSDDGCVRVWDIRQDNNKPALELKDTSQHTGPPLNKNKPLLCVAANDSGLIVAGTEQVGQDAYLLFWDMKNGGEMVGGYWSVHSDDVTCLKFSDDAQDTLISGSTDGLVNVLNLSNPDEDEALAWSHNTGDSVAGVCWKDSDTVVVSTHTEAVQMLGVETEVRHVLSREKICSSIKRSVRDHIYTAGVHVSKDSHVSVLAGSRHVGSPCLRMCSLTDNGLLQPEAEFIKCGSSVRCLLSFEEESLITGGEEGVVRVWRKFFGQEEELSRKLGSSHDSSKVRNKPYSK